MTIADAMLFSDDRGVWRKQSPGRVSGIEWNEIHRVSVHKLDGITEVHTCVVLDFEFGDYFELFDHWPGFKQVVAEITARLPGIDTGWLQNVERIGIADSPMIVWRRQTSHR